MHPFVSQERLAERAELHRTYTSSLERGEKNISLTRLVRLAAALGAPLSTLIATMERELKKAG
jgi:transcriptional regulator with XRE-family HTH domain